MTVVYEKPTILITQDGISGNRANAFIDEMNAGVAATAADRVQTGLDRAVTAADRVQTGLDRSAAAASAAQAALYDGPWLDTVAALELDTSLTYTAALPGTVVTGDYVQTRAEGFAYQVVASGAVDHQITTAGGVKLRAINFTSPAQVADLGTATATQTVAAFQAALSEGGNVEFPAGVFTFNAPATVDYDDVPYFHISSPLSKRVNIQGQLTKSQIVYTGTSGAALQLWGSPPVLTDGFGVDGCDKISGFYLRGNSPAATITGIHARRKAFANYSDLFVEDFTNGIYLEGCLSSTFSNVHFRHCINGINIDGGSFSRANAMTMNHVRVAENSNFGIVAAGFGAGNTINGLICEGNGTMATNTGGAFFNLSGDNGLGSIHINMPYFEVNKGLADLYLDNMSASPMTVIVSGGTFNRVSSAEYTTNNIHAASSGGGKLTIILQGCAFWSGGSYVPSAARPFWATSGNVEIIQIGCAFSEEISLPSKQSRNGGYAGSVNADGTAAISVKGITTVKSATGVYTVSCAEKFGASSTGFVVNATSTDASGGIKVERLNRSGATSFVVVTSNNAGALADCPFDWSVVRLS